jgi:hypothetical protein
VGKQAWRKQRREKWGRQGRRWVSNVCKTFDVERYEYSTDSDGSTPRTAFRYDCSDATGMALFGALRLEPLRFANNFSVASFGLPKRRVGVSLCLPGTTSSERPEEETATTISNPSPVVLTSFTPIPVAIAPSPRMCTLCPGCVLPPWHSGTCRVQLLSPRKGKRKRPFDSEEGPS